MKGIILHVSIILAFVIVLSSCRKAETKDGETKCNCSTFISPKSETSPLFKNSIVSIDIDFICEEDYNTFKTLTYKGQAKKEMPDSRSDILFDNKTYIFNSSFESGNDLEIWCHSDFKSIQNAQEYAEKVCSRLGKIPIVQRGMLSHVVIHKGDETAFAENGFFVLYSDNMDIRIRNNDLEETVFHESIHASIQTIYEKTDAWKQCQLADGNYITDYALSQPGLEDMPETAMFAYTIIKHPGRLSISTENWVKDYIPNRLVFFRRIYQ